MKTLCFIFAFIGFTHASFGQAPAEFDITNWDGKKTLSLEMDWDFWPFSKANPLVAPVKVHVPGKMNSALGTNEGWGTYRIAIKAGERPAERVGLYLPTINSSYEMYLNGALVYKVGHVSASENTFVPERRTKIVELSLQPGINYLDFTVSSWGDQYAGLNEVVRFGSLENLYDQRNSDISVTVFMFGALFIMGIYHIGMFLYRPKNRSPLWFGLLSLLLGLRGLVYGPTFMIDIATWVGYNGIMLLGYLSFSGATLCFCLFIYEYFKPLVPRWFLWVSLVGSGTYALANIILPVGLYSKGLTIYQIYVGLFGLVIVFHLIKACVKRVYGSLLFLSGFIIFFSTVVHDILKSMFSLPTPDLSTLGLLLFLIFQSLVLLRSFTDAFTSSEKFAMHLSHLNQSLERFIPKKFLSFLKKDSIVDIKLGDHIQADMAVMFSDIRDFTTLSESMTPQENFNFINSYLSRIGPIVRKHGGFVDKYLGDGIMALFPNRCEDAIQAALDIRNELKVYNDHRASFGYKEIYLGIGIHFGPLMLGTIGENERMDSTVISDTVNTASRLEGLSRKFVYDMLISGQTIDKISKDELGQFTVDFLGEETVKGKSNSIKVYGLNIKKLDELKTIS